MCDCERITFFDFQRQTFDKNDHEIILTKKVQDEPVLQTRNCILFVAFEYSLQMILVTNHYMYENKPIQINRKFHLQKLKIFR